MSRLEEGCTPVLLCVETPCTQLASAALAQSAKTVIVQAGCSSQRLLAQRLVQQLTDFILALRVRTCTVQI